ncbi:MAG: peptidoglycan DD-metalloendopeptidase family protein [Acidobacteriota bacterium]
MILVAASAGFAQEAGPPGELETIRSRVRELEGHLRGLEQRQAVVGNERQRVSTELALATLKVTEAEAELAAIARVEAEAAQAATAAQERLRVAVDGLRVNLGLLALLGRAGLSPLLLYSLRGQGELARKVTVTMAVVQEHRKRRDEVASLLERRTAAVGELSRRREELSAGRARLAERRAQLGEVHRRAQVELARLETERRAGAVALAEVREAEARLERLWGRLGPGHEGGDGDVRLLRGGLPWPVEKARVLKRFGTTRDPQYGTSTVSHGLLLAAPAGAQVRAIAAGKVAYAQFFKGYGNVVIVEHGGDVFSLYAQLASIFPRAGQRVAMAEAMGIVGRGEDAGAGIYLEIRVGQRPQDPLGWLKPAGK